MNCQQFTSLIVEAARGRMMDAAARDGATRHAETCAACAARLARERSLTGALRVAAAGMRDLSAPARVEAKLLAAFRENRANSRPATADAAHAPAAPHAHLAPLAPAEPAADELAARRASSRRQTRRAAFTAATAVAASLALVALVALYQQFTRTSTPPKEMTKAAPHGGRESSPAAPVVASLSPPSTPADSSQRTERDASRQTRRPDSRPTRAKTARPAATRMIVSRQVIDGGRAVFAPGDGESVVNHAGGGAKPAEAESVTEFISLDGGARAAAPLESGQLVRVQMPRAALASLGLPLNAERGNEPVKADVLLGNDGLARAIRFVR